MEGLLDRRGDIHSQGGYSEDLNGEEKQKVNESDGLRRGRVKLQYVKHVGKVCLVWSKLGSHFGWDRISSDVD